MDRQTHSGDASNLLFYVMAAIIVGFLLAFLIIRPGHGLN
jgi:hypothetical protein